MAPRSWTLVELIRTTTEYFDRHGIATPRLDAEVLLAHVLSMERIGLYLAFDQPIARADLDRFRELVRRRAKERIPVAYLTGMREFWSMAFHVTPDVLIPRPDTETLVRAALALRPTPGRILEVGVGSGCISAALARELPAARICAVDVCPRALAVARHNLEALGLAERIELVESDGSLAAHGGGSFDLIVSNPPYVPSEQILRLEPEVQHEPRGALDGGGDGLDVIRPLVEGAPRQLARPGWLLLEVGQGQARRVAERLACAGAERVEIEKDLGGIERVVAGRFGAEAVAG